MEFPEENTREKDPTAQPAPIGGHRWPGAYGYPGDRGRRLPIPHGPQRIDLAVRAGCPLLDVLRAVLEELAIQEVVIAEEMAGHSPQLRAALREVLGDVPVRTLPTRISSARRAPRGPSSARGNAPPTPTSSWWREWSSDERPECLDPARAFHWRAFFQRYGLLLTFGLLCLR